MLRESADGANEDMKTIKTVVAMVSDASKDVVSPLTRRLSGRHLHSRCLFSSLSPLQVRVGEFKETSELFVGRLSGADDGRHAGAPDRPPLIR